MIELKNCHWKDFEKEIQGKRLYCFGCGNLIEWLRYEICNLQLAKHIIAFVDNDDDKIGTCIELDGCIIPIISFSDFIKYKDEVTIMLITNMYYQEILEQMDREVALDGMICYIEVFLKEDTESVSILRNQTNITQIPKKIHYCWFGKGEIPEIYQMYIESWKKFCPDYEIMQWDESNYNYDRIKYTKQAYDCRKWAFVSDYARLDIVYNHGGIYLDVDVEVIQNLDPLLNNKMFCGFEQGNNIATGLGFGVVKGFEALREMSEMYNEIPFIFADGKLNLTPCTKYQTEYLMEKGLRRNGKEQLIDGIRIYPRTVLAPVDFYGIKKLFSKNTFTIHHYAATWFDKEKSKESLLKNNEEIIKRMRNNE